MIATGGSRSNVVAGGGVSPGGGVAPRGRDGAIYLGDFRGVVQGGDITAPFLSALALAQSRGGGRIIAPPASFELDAQVYKVPSNTVLAGFGPASRLRIDSNNAANNARIEFDGVTRSGMEDIAVEEMNVQGRVGVYGLVSVSGGGAHRFRGVEVEGSSGTGMHFRGGCEGIDIFEPNVHHNKADGIHFQRGAKRGRIIGGESRNNGDDAVAFVSHDFNGWGHVRDFQVVGTYMGDTTPGAPGSGVAIIGAVGVVLDNPFIANTALSGIRITEGNFGAEGYAVCGRVQVNGGVIYKAGLYSGGTAGLVKDGISIFNSRNVAVRGTIIDSPVSVGVRLSQSFVDIDLTDVKVLNAGSRGIWLAPLEQTSANALQLWTDPLLSNGENLALGYVFAHKIRIVRPVVDKCGIDAFYAEGTVTRNIDQLALIDPDFQNWNVDNSGNNRGVYARYVAGWVYRNAVLRQQWPGSSVIKEQISDVIAHVN